MHKVHWDDLQYVHAVIEHGSLSAASRALGVNHATVLRRIALLEAAYDIKLFERRNDGYRLLPEGRALLASLKLMDQASARIMRSLALTSKGIEGSFRLATTDSIACLQIPGYLEQLRAVHSSINIEVVVSNNPIDMSLSGAEILIRPGGEMPPDLSGIRAGSIEFCVYGAPDYLKEAAGLPARDLKWLGVAPHFARSTAGEWLFANAQTSFEFSADSFLALASMAARGLGVTMLPDFIGRQTEGLVAVDRMPTGPETGLWVATHKDFRRQSNIETLLNFFAEAIKADDQLGS
ncbi:LysR family transcriptional regulator [Roseibium sp.]|uniref:LysR family transcriptional regulator n=1 Tax=Roseibium sp. TaxID=1936156 RepID=UPI003B51CE47